MNEPPAPTDRPHPDDTVAPADTANITASGNERPDDVRPHSADTAAPRDAANSTASDNEQPDEPRAQSERPEDPQHHRGEPAAQADSPGDIPGDNDRPDEPRAQGDPANEPRAQSERSEAPSDDPDQAGGYKVALEVYSGPMDLLLYLIRREEVDIYDIPIARVTEQYLQYVALVRQLDPEAVSEFLVLAATLMEIKSRMLLPRPPLGEDEDEDVTDPRLELVRQLLEYKKFKDAAYHLDESAREHARKHPRSPVLPPMPQDEVELDNIDIWDLFDAFNRLLEQTGKREGVHRVGVDDTLLALHEADICDAVERAGGSRKFEDVFTGRSKPEMIGLFLALLELIRQRRVRVTQDRPFGTIWIFLLKPTEPDDEDTMTDTDRSAHDDRPHETATTEIAPGYDSTEPADGDEPLPKQPRSDKSEAGESLSDDPIRHDANADRTDPPDTQAGMESIDSDPPTEQPVLIQKGEHDETERETR